MSGFSSTSGLLGARRDVSLRYLLRSAAVAIAAILVLMAAIVGVGIPLMASERSQAYDVNRQAQLANRGALISVIDARALLATYAATRSPGDARAVEVAVDTGRAQLAAFDAATAGAAPQIASAARAFHDDVQQWWQHYAPIHAQVASGADPRPALAQLDTTGLAAQSRSLTEAIGAELDRHQNNASTIQLWIVVVEALLGLLTAILAARWIGALQRNVVQPLLVTRDVIGRHTAGPSGDRAPVATSITEVRALATAYNRLADTSERHSVEHRETLSMLTAVTSVNVAMRSRSDAPGVLRIVLNGVSEAIRPDRAAAFACGSTGQWEQVGQWSAPGLPELPYYPKEMVDQLGVTVQPARTSGADVLVLDPDNPSHRLRLPQFEAVKGRGIRSLLVAAVHRRGRMYGLVGFGLTEQVRDWTATEIDVLRAITDHAAFVICAAEHEGDGHPAEPESATGRG